MVSTPHACQAALIAAPASGQGKTTVTAALARLARAQGKRVRVFKTGPDFLDPTIHAQASGQPCYQLDLFMGGEAHCRALIAAAAQDADLILVEGVMGLYDGSPSSADLAQALGLPILLVIDGSAMAQTFGAIAQGLIQFRTGLECVGVIANRVANAKHAKMLLESLPSSMRGLGWLPRKSDIHLPERHLGLLPAKELADLDTRLDRAAFALHCEQTHWPSWQGPSVPVEASLVDKPLAGARIAIAQDEAFCFIYPANLDTLRALGAELQFFSPIHDECLPDCDALWLPGGYPELHAELLAQNTGLHQALRAHHGAGKPILAECGGMMYLFEHLYNLDGASHAGVGLLPGDCRMQTTLAGLGLQSVDLPEGNLRGHSFHYSKCETSLAPIALAFNPNNGQTAESVYRIGRLTASYIHFYFPSNARALAALFLP